MLIRHRIFQVMAALLVLLGLAFGPAGVAPASAASEDCTIRQEKCIIRPIETTGITLIVEKQSKENGARIVLGDARAGDFQNWVFIPVPDARDTFYIQSVETGKVMSVNSREEGSPVLQWDNQGVLEQQWTQIWTEQGNKFRNAYTGLYMDVRGESDKAGTPIIQWRQTTGRNQEFRLIPSNE